MKQLIIMFISFGYCFGMNYTMSGLDQHPHWPDQEYQHAAQDCFSHLDGLQQKAAVKNFCTKKQIMWQGLLNPDIQYYPPHEIESETKLLSKEEGLLKESNFFFTKWDDSTQFMPSHPLTARGHDNTAILCIFFKDFTCQVLDLYSKARHAIVRKIDPTYVYDGNEYHPSIQKLYPTKSDQIQALLKEAIKVNDALLKCFDAS